MKYLKTFEGYTLNSVLYHGSDTQHTFGGKGYLVEGTFFSEDIEVAKSHGKYVYEVVVKNIKIFDSIDKYDVEKLFNYFGKLYDSYEDGYIDINTFMGSSDTWNAIENTDGVISWLIDQGYRGVRITEGGSESNILLFYPNEDIIEYEMMEID